MLLTKRRAEVLVRMLRESGSQASPDVDRTCIPLERAGLTTATRNTWGIASRWQLTVRGVEVGRLLVTMERTPS